MACVGAASLKCGLLGGSRDHGACLTTTRTTRNDEPGLAIMGYHFHAGGKWSGDYFVMDWNAFKNATSHVDAYVHRTREVVLQKPLKFPVKTGELRNEDPILNPQQPPLADVEDQDEVVPRVDEVDGVEHGPEVQDSWERRGMYITRINRVPRRDMFIPTDAGDPSC